MFHFPFSFLKFSFSVNLLATDILTLWELKASPRDIALLGLKMKTRLCALWWSAGLDNGSKSLRTLELTFVLSNKSWGFFLCCCVTVIWLETERRIVYHNWFGWSRPQIASWIWINLGDWCLVQRWGKSWLREQSKHDWFHLVLLNVNRTETPWLVPGLLSGQSVASSVLYPVEWTWEYFHFSLAHLCCTYGVGFISLSFNPLNM